MKHLITLNCLLRGSDQEWRDTFGALSWMDGGYSFFFVCLYVSNANLEQIYELFLKSGIGRHLESMENRLIWKENPECNVLSTVTFGREMWVLWVIGDERSY
jgi:hypothetical protein